MKTFISPRTVSRTVPSVVASTAARTSPFAAHRAASATVNTAATSARAIDLAAFLTLIALAVITALLFVPSLARAQFLEDGLRYAQHTSSNSGIETARTAALGVSYHGLADDYAALFFNPAGLTLIPSTEFTIGARLLANTATTTYWGSSQSTPLGSAFALSHAGIAIPIRSAGGTWALGLGYARENDFFEREGLGGLNTSSSMIQSFVRSQTGSELEGNRAYRLFVADTVRGRFVSPVRGNLAQSATTQQTGGVNSLSVGVGGDLAQGFAVGVSVIGSFGSYTYNRDFQEFDARNMYDKLDIVNFTNVDFTRLNVQESIFQEVGGVRAVLGLQGRIGEAVRVGGSVTTPGAYVVRESSSWNGSTTFDDNTQKNYAEDRTASFIVYTPWTFALGASANVAGITLTGGFEYADLKSLSFSRGQFDTFNDRTFYAELTRSAGQYLRGQMRYGIGAEYELPNNPLVLRAGYTYTESPYVNAAVYSETNTFSAGLGVYVSAQSRFDFSARFNTRLYQGLAYGAEDARYRGTQTTGQLAAQFVVRF